MTNFRIWRIYVVWGLFDRWYWKPIFTTRCYTLHGQPYDPTFTWGQLFITWIFKAPEEAHEVTTTTRVG